MDVICSSENFTSQPKRLPKPFEYASNKADVFEAFESGFFTGVIGRTTSLSPESKDDMALALRLWYIRIQSLLFLHLGFYAAEEINKSLRPVFEPDFTESLETTEMKLAAFKLRLLLVPVRTKGINQSTVASYDAMGGEARAYAREAQNDTEIEKKWLSLLELGGIYALSSLVALQEYETCVEFCRTHFSVTKNVFYAKTAAMLNLTIGDTFSARYWIDKVSEIDSEEGAKILAVVKFSDEDGDRTYPALVDFYSGKVKDALTELESAAMNQHSANGALLSSNIANLFAVYDLVLPDAEEHRQKFVNSLESPHLESTEMTAYFRTD